jgi:hypothetical protein
MLNPRRHTRRALAAAALIAGTTALVVGPSVATAVGPAVNAYTENLPSAKGKGQQTGVTPTANPSELSSAVQRQLSRSPDGKALAALATAPALGAPAASAGSGTAGTAASDVASGDSPSFFTATWRALDDLPVLLGGLGLLAVILAFGLRSRLGRPRTGQ